MARLYIFFVELLRKKSYKINFKIVQKSFWLILV